MGHQNMFDFLCGLGLFQVEETQAPSGGESEWLERGDHPLFNDVILDPLFRFVNRCDLKACRGVSKKWNLRTIPHMRSTFRVTIHGSQSTAGTKNSRRIRDFVQLFSSNDFGIPFESFRLGPFCTTDRVGQRFLQLCGVTTTKIDMNVVEYGNYGMSEVNTIEDVSQLLKCCPNLKVLALPSRLTSRSGSIVKLFPHSIPTFSCLKKITFQKGSDNDARVLCPSPVDELLTAAPNISDIVVSDISGWYDEEEGDEEGSDISSVLNVIEKLGRVSSIQSLHLYEARIQHIEHLRRMAQTPNGLKLKSLTFCPSTAAVDGYFNTVQIQLAGIFKDTLQHLTVDCGLNYETDLMGFPYMSHLKSLEFIPQSTAAIPVNLTHHLPALERL